MPGLKCPLCNSEPPLKILTSHKAQKNRYFVQCPVCDLVFVPEMFHLAPQDEAARYRLHDNTLLNKGYIAMFLEKINVIHEFCTGIYSVLDYGCGPEPVLAQLLKREGFDCDVFDPYFFPGFPKGQYDLVISTEVFEHFRDIQTELHKIRQLIAPGGFLAVMTSFHDAIADFSEWWYPSDPTHVCFFSMRTFEWISRQFGYKVVYTNHKNFIILRVK
ncbi:Ubiquinone biosynthesis O-methyltransferase [uncultured archaeon]|nr:Ubiquinone biosynthesis O-methyltransferase [uncultured archaeon]